MNKDSAEYYCGSRINADKEKLKENINSFASHVKNKLSSVNDIVEKHNTYCAYTIILMGYSTGHRPVNDPFCFIEDIDLTGGFIAINDKVSSAANNSRISTINEGAKQQIENYLNHIKALADLAFENNHIKQAQKINSLMEVKKASEQSIPLFFFIDSKFDAITITPTLLTSQISEIWPYEDNHNRHHIETNLSENTHRMLIDVQLGHQQVQNHLLGANSSWSGFECLSELSSQMNTIQNNLNWPCIEGVNSKKSYEIPNKRHPPDKLYGYLKRQNSRLEKIKKLEIEVKEILLREISLAGGIEAYALNTDFHYDSIAKVLEECRSSDTLSNKAISIFIDLLNTKLKECKSTPIKKLQVLQQEASPFPDGWLQEFVQGRNTRELFIQELILSRKENKSPDMEEQWATIIVSSVLFGAFYNPTWVAFLLEKGPSQIKKFKKWIYFVDIWSSPPSKNPEKIDLIYQSPDWRWQPDSFTRTLLLRMLKDHDLKIEYSSKKVKSHLNTITTNLGISGDKKKSSIDLICHRMKAYWGFHLPKYIENIFISQSTTMPLPQNSLARLCYSKYIPAKIKPIQKETKNKLNEEQSENKKNIKEYLSFIRLSLNEVELSNKNSKKIQLNKLNEKIIDIHNQYSFPPVAESLSQWIIHMCKYGTQKLDEPTVSTIDTYFSTIALQMALHIGNEDLTDLDEVEISLIYKNIIEGKTSNKGKKYTANRLLFFHKIMVLYDLTECEVLDWQDIAGKYLNMEEFKVNSNIVTIAEYNHCLEQIKYSQLSAFNKSWMAVFMIFGYRFGLRVSEIRRLRYQDVQCFGNDIIIQCRNTKQGRTKSRAGVRQVPLLGVLTPIEQDFINNHLKKEIFGNSHSINDLLFYSPSDTNKPLDKNLIWEQIHRLLRITTGDFRVRFHHLRHSYINAHYYGNLVSHGFKVFEEISKTRWVNFSLSAEDKLLENDVFQTYILESLSSVVGHSNQSVTIASYLHLIDDVSISYAEKAKFPDILLEDLSIISGYEINTLKNRIKSKGLNRIEFNAHELLKTIQIGDLIPAYKHKTLKFPCIENNLKRNLSELTLSEINKIIKIMHTNSMPLDFIAHQKSLDKSEIENLFEIAKETEIESGYEYFYINKNRWLSTYVTHSQVSLNQEQIAIERVFEKIQKYLDDKNHFKIFKETTVTWKAINELHEPSSVFIFKTPELLLSMTDGLKLVGYDINDFTYSIPSSINKIESKAIKEKLLKIGIKKSMITEAKSRMLSSGSAKDRFNYVSAKISKNITNKALPKNTLSLNRIFFILAIKLKVIDSVKT